ncbi:MAG: hypothetical protein IT385_02000 [Deltaproteobacteria bacterium]|nr:hypothetical protein [Deltaproteobacteria bacterium]
MRHAPWPALIAAGLVGCNEESSAPREPLPLVASEIGPLAADNLRGMNLALDDASGWVADAELAGWLLDVAGTDDEAIEDPVGGEPAPDEQTMHERIDELADRLADELLVAANVTHEEVGVVVFTIPIASLCPAEGDAPADAECVARFTANPLSVRVVSYAPGELELTLQVGADALAPLVVTLGRTRVAAEIDSAALLTSLERLGTTLLDTAERADELTLLAATGRVRLELDKRGVRTVELALTVSSGLDIEAELGGHPIALTLARSSLSLVLDAARERVSLTSDVGALGARLPYQLMADMTAEDDAEPATVQGELVLDLAGQGARLELDEAAAELRVEGLGLGARRSTLSLAGSVVVGVDLTAGRGREIAATLRQDADGLSLVVSPGMELVLELGLDKLAAIEPELATGWAASETLGIALDGASAPALQMGDEMRVTAGRLALVSTARPELSLEVKVGQCLVADELDDEAPLSEEETATHPLEHLHAGSCAAP